ncbi:hypothetical protein [Microvirga massiliensis]
MVRNTGAFEVNQPEGSGLRVRLKASEAKSPPRKAGRRRRGAGTKTTD